MLTALAASITALGVIWLKGLRPALRRTRAGIRTVQRVFKALDRLIPFAEEQLRSNGGSTAKDQFDRIDTEVKGFSMRFEEFLRENRERQAVGDERHRENVERLDLIESKHASEERYLALEEKLAKLAGDKGDEE